MKIAGAVVDHGSAAAVMITNPSAAVANAGEPSHARRPRQATGLGRSSIVSSAAVMISASLSLRGHQKVRRRIAGEKIARLGLVSEPFRELIAPLPNSS